MSMRLIPESLAATPPTAFDRPALQRPDTRPIEQSGQSGNAGANNTGARGQPSDSSGFAAARAAMSPRPPGIDPSVPPQTLLDASLISATFKPDPHPADLQKKAEDVAKDEAKRANTAAEDGSGQDESGGALAAAADTTAGAQGGSPKVDAGKIEAYASGSGGSPLSPASAANPDWMSAVERIA